MSDTETHKSESPEPAELDSARDSTADIAAGDTGGETDAALEAVARMDESAEQLLSADPQPEEIAEDLNHLIADVESLGEVISAEHEKTLPDDPPTATSDAPSIEQTGASAVDASEALFDSDFDPVEDVLDTVFETKASLVQRGESTTVTVREELVPDVSEESLLVGGEDDEHFESSDAVQNADQLAPDDEPEMQPVALHSTEVEPEAATPELFSDAADEDQTVVLATGESPADAVEETPVADDADGTAAGNTVDDESDAVDAPIAAPAQEEEPTQPLHDAEPVTAADADVPEPQQEQESKFDYVAWLVAKFNALFGGGLPGVKNALVLSNRPMRYVPPSLRPLVDYLALTLIMWVPIVWAIVWLVRR